MLKELSREPQDSDTVPLWALQAFTQTSAMRTEQKTPPLIEARENPPTPIAPLVQAPEADRALTALVMLFAVLNAADLLSTFVGLHSGMHEGNPLMGALLARYGFAALILYKALVVTAVAWGVRTLRSFRASVANVTIVICDLLVFAVVIANLAQYALKP